MVGAAKHVEVYGGSVGMGAGGQEEVGAGKGWYTVGGPGRVWYVVCGGEGTEVSATPDKIEVVHQKKW